MSLHQAPPANDDNPCVRCGACCAHFRVSFYWTQALQSGLPEDLYEPLTPLLGCMKGTDQKTPRCVALEGDIGQRVRCTVYPHRTEPCREVQAGDDKCQRARARHGLPAL